MNVEQRNMEPVNSSSCSFSTSWWTNNIYRDDAGNMTTDKAGYKYYYDYENRIVKIKDSSSDDEDIHDQALEAAGGVWLSSFFNYSTAVGHPELLGFFTVEQCFLVRNLRICRHNCSNNTRLSS